MDIGVATGIGLGVAGIGSCAVLDRIIDVTAHDHSTLAYRAGGVPTRALAFGALALAGAGLLARTSDSTRDYSTPLLKMAAGAGAAYAATMAVRLGWGLTVAPAQAGWKPGMRALPHMRLGDIAANAIDRTRMMGTDPDLAHWPIFDLVSRVQGHGHLVDRASEFVPVLR
ncbi:MAG: hypothetical protein KDC46_04050 [Thermoleophilia bacterium]|nr:hypothetical protein [Thermoleophilia bacterium]